MYISRVVIRNFRNFRMADFPVSRNTTCIVGENNTGKTNLVFALRLALDARMSFFDRRLEFEDFPEGIDATTPTQSLVSVEIRDFAANENESAMVLGCEIEDDLARLTYRFRPRRAIRDAIEAEDHDGTNLTPDDYHWEMSGGGNGDPVALQWNDDFGRSVRFEELSQSYLLTFMEPLRDVEKRLRQTRQSPLTQLLTPSDIPQEEQDALVSVLADANRKIESSKTIKAVGEDIEAAFDDAAGKAFSMAVKLGIGSASFNAIARSLTVLLSNHAMSDFTPDRNGLGLNNILYISMLLKFFERRVAEEKTAGQLLIVEEPEAHLHPQLQRVLFGTLQRKGFQTIVTTHSSHITSQANLSSIVVLSNDGTPATKVSVPGIHEGEPTLTDLQIKDLERYLDATRATLLFARKVMLVEGPAESFLLPPLVEAVMDINLEEYGISVIPIHGIHFNSYAALFGDSGIQRKCAIVSDGDLAPSDAVSEDDDELGDDIPDVDLEALENDFVKVFRCATTFERAITIRGTLDMMILTIEQCGFPVVLERLREAKDSLPEAGALSEDQKEVLKEARNRILRAAKRVGKARFAQIASRYVSEATRIPRYIREAVEWLIDDEA